MSVVAERPDRRSRSSPIALAGSACGGAPRERSADRDRPGRRRRPRRPAPPPTGDPTRRPSTAVAGVVSAEPPAATLAAEGGDPVAGQLGSYTWAGGGSDSPWLPGRTDHRRRPASR